VTWMQLSTVLSAVLMANPGMGKSPDHPISIVKLFTPDLLPGNGQQLPHDRLPHRPKGIFWSSVNANSKGGAHSKHLVNGATEKNSSHMSAFNFAFPY
jgi:hypothetical protein